MNSDYYCWADSEAWNDRGQAISARNERLAAEFYAERVLRSANEDDVDNYYRETFVIRVVPCDRPHRKPSVWDVTLAASVEEVRNVSFDAQAVPA